jgi:hypothetical protein
MLPLPMLAGQHMPQSPIARMQGELKLAATGAGGSAEATADDSSVGQQVDAQTEEDEFDLADLMSEEIEVKASAHCKSGLPGRA